MRRLLVPLIWPVLCGVLLAIVLLDHLPNLVDTPTSHNRSSEYDAGQQPRRNASTTRAHSDPVSRQPPRIQTAAPLKRGDAPAGSYADAVARAAPAVVNVYSSRLVEQNKHPLMSDPFFKQFFKKGDSNRQRMLSSLGSGVIVSSDGYILTNNHVISGADEIQVALRDGRETLARVIGTDPETDLAVLKIDLDNLPVISLADSAKLRIGDVALAIGNPFGVGQTVTMGIISAVGRNHLGLNAYEDFIQTDAAINPGNSGGALVNADGALVGINTAIFSRTGGSQGIGFAIPTDLARDILNDIVTKGRVVRGWLGIEAHEVPSALANSLNINAPRGVIVSDVVNGSPADKAGVKPGDVLLSVDGKTMLDAQSAMVDVAELDPGEKLPLKLYRDGKTIQVTVTVGIRPPNAPSGAASESHADGSTTPSPGGQSATQ
ncbi:S1C family serine protease [Kushneria phosphatilytica]|uniref:Do family serine endopeptidase n=1 Tax=Kushneria phosphatilytica TaxID=657387 RepID=A0A1S1NXE7_9GAMM|nr:Do family serine endopeptidase [Kushneria phosphatilytica]OHV12240.1 transcriptional regulator [Kushneria phosphatilytica]QEL11442.1 Do family serine endopeptidase [Kushneria phosphatilytica]